MRPEQDGPEPGAIVRARVGPKGIAQNRLFRGDKMGFLAGLRELDWPMDLDRVEAALDFYQL